MKPTLESKTIRPGLAAYSFYRSDRHPQQRRSPQPKPRKAATSGSLIKVLSGVALVATVLGAILFGYKSASGGDSPVATAAKKQQAAAAVTAKNECADNATGKLIRVNITQRHLWACDGKKSSYDSPVITGMAAHASTVTPTGTYHIYAKQADTVLTGSDETGSWRDPVSYWMPFLDNQYGTYGFHDATWRKDAEFGTVDQSSNDASHGCVELPLATSKWLYDWSAVGTTLTIES